MFRVEARVYGLGFREDATRAWARIVFHSLLAAAVSQALE